MSGHSLTRRSFLGSSIALAAQAPTKPNILLLLADNWAFPHASIYRDPVLRTPVFDRLASEGLLFKNAFAPNPSCSPSRSNLLTGRETHRLGEAASLYGPLRPDHVTYVKHHIDPACEFTAGVNYEEFARDIRTLFAVTRCLEIISEASRRLPDELKQRHSHIAWRDMAGAGNIYRHDYRTLPPSWFGTLCNWPCRICAMLLTVRFPLWDNMHFQNDVIRSSTLWHKPATAG